MKKDKTKNIFLDQLKKTPIIQVACDKVGVARWTVYRWKQEDLEFATKFDEALKEGRELVNDVAVSQLLNAIKDGNMRAIELWLKHFDVNFKTKVEISGTIKQLREELTEEEADMIAEALKLAGFSQEQININQGDIKHDKLRESELPDRTDQAQPPAEAKIS